MAANSHNPSYCGGRDQGDFNLRLAQAKSYQDPHLNKEFRCGNACLSSYLPRRQRWGDTEVEGSRSQSGPGKNTRPFLENN
jgi:hypothetical protein